MSLLLLLRGVIQTSGSEFNLTIAYIPVSSGQVTHI